MDSVKVGSDFFARGANFATNEMVLLRYSTIGSTLDISGASILKLDLTSTNILAEFRLGSGIGKKPQWRKNSKMVLWNTVAGAVQDADEYSWPDELELEGFSYRLGGYGATGNADILNRKSSAFINWLDRDKTFSPQPYEYLANVLTEAGFPSKGNAIRHAARKKSRKEAIQNNNNKEPEYLRWLGLIILQSTIGFGLGIRYFRVLIWLVAFAGIGFLVLLNSTDAAHRNLFEMAWASFDVTLPIITLNPAYEEYIFSDCSNGVKAYFYFQKIIGYILGGFIVAGLAGLTQKNT